MPNTHPLSPSLSPEQTNISAEKPILLKAVDLKRHYDVTRGLWQPNARVQALAGASFTLRAGQTLAIVGESGSGKSTLARLLTMIEPPSSGFLEINGIDIGKAQKHQLHALRRDVQIVFQNPYGALNPRQTIGAALEEPLLIHTPLSADARKEAALAMMARVGLRPEFYTRYPHMFSGGQRQRIAIARALMLRPKILVLDEPVSALDVSIRAQVLNLLQDLQEELGLAYLFISHDLSVVRHIADDIMVIYLGHAVEIGAKAEIFAHPRHPYTHALLAATPLADPRHKRERVLLKGELPSPFDPPSGCPFHPRCPRASEKCAREKPILEATSSGALACWHPHLAGE